MDVGDGLKVPNQVHLLVAHLAKEDRLSPALEQKQLVECLEGRR